MKTRHRKTYTAIALAATIACAGCNQSNPNATQSSTDDALIATQVRAKAIAIDPATVSLIHVASDHGKVTLTGKVANATERTAIEDAAHSVNGVHEVVDRIAVDKSAPTGKQIADDLTLAARIHAALAAQTGVNAARIHVDVHRGVVTLTGSLPSAAHREVADQTVRGIPGVVTLNDNITIEEK